MRRASGPAFHGKGLPHPNPTSQRIPSGAGNREYIAHPRPDWLPTTSRSERQFKRLFYAVPRGVSRTRRQAAVRRAVRGAWMAVDSKCPGGMRRDRCRGAWITSHTASFRSTVLLRHLLKHPLPPMVRFLSGNGLVNYSIEECGPTVGFASLSLPGGCGVPTGFEIRNRLLDLNASTSSPPDIRNLRNDLSWNRHV